MWGSEHPHAVIEHAGDSPKNLFAAIYRIKRYGPFFFAEKNVTGLTYLDMLERWVMHNLKRTHGILISKVELYSTTI